MPVTTSVTGSQRVGVWRRYRRFEMRRPFPFTLGATNVFVDEGTIPITITLTSTDTLDSVDAGTIPLTISLSGTDLLNSVDAGTIPILLALSAVENLQSQDPGTIPLTITLSGVDSLASVDAGTIPLTITMSGSDQFGPTTGQAFNDLRDVRSPKQLPIKP